MKRLKNIGFVKAGNWLIKNDELEYDLVSYNSEKNILYCFVCNDNIKYIGKTVKTVSQRMYGYKKPSKSQRTNFRVNKEIEKFLKNGKDIDIYILTDNGLLNFGDFRINIAAGLEDTLIAEYEPDWNYNGKKKMNQKKGKTEIKTDYDSPTSRTIYNDNEFENKFVVALGKKYYNDGFFNVRVKHSDFFGEDLSKIKIQLGENSSNYCIGKINRTANRNGTPRKFAGAKYKKWIQENFERGDLFHVKIIDSDYIKLTKKQTPDTL